MLLSVTKVLVLDGLGHGRHDGGGYLVSPVRLEHGGTLVRGYLLRNSFVPSEVEAEFKLKVRPFYERSRSTSMLNFRLLASKMIELWLSKYFDLRGRG